MTAGARALLVSLMAISFAASAAAAIDFQASPFGATPQLDEAAFVSWARALTQGQPPGGGAFFVDPLYPYFLGGLLWVSQGSLLFCRLAQAALAATTVLWAFLIARRLFGEREGLLAAGLVAFYGALHFQAALLLKESLATALAAAACLLAMRAVETGRFRDWLWAGMALGGFTLLRGNALAVFAGVVAYALWLRRAALWKGLMSAGLGCLCGGLLVMGPVALRNFSVSGELALTTNGGANFFLGNSPQANGAYPILPFVRATPDHEEEDFKAEAERRTGKVMTAGAVSAYWYGEAFAFIRTHPAEAFRLLWTKARLLVSRYEVPDHYSLSCMRDLFMPGLWLGFVSFGPLVALGLAGMGWAFRAVPQSRVAILFAALYGLTLVGYFVLSRYRLPLVPFLAVFASRALLGWVGSIRARQLGAVAGWSLGTAAIAALAYAPTPQSLRESEHYAHCCHLAGTLLQDQGDVTRSLELLELAAGLAPEVDDNLYNYAQALHQGAQPRKAEAVYQEVLRRQPGHAKANYNLALLLLPRRDFATAERLLASAHQAGLSHAGVLGARGEALEGMGDLDRALAAYLSALAKEPANQRVMVRLAMLGLNSNQCGPAMAAWENFRKAGGQLSSGFQATLLDKCAGPGSGP